MGGKVALNSAVWVPAAGFHIDETMKDAVLICDKLFPPHMVPTDHGTYTVIPIEALKKVYNTIRAAKASFPTADYTTERGTFTTNNYGWKETIDKIERAQYEQENIDPDLIASERMMEIMMVDKERAAAAIVQNPSVMTNTAAVTTEWSNPAADIFGDVKTHARLIRGRTGVKKKFLSLFVNDLIFENMQQNTALKDQIKYTYGTAIDINHVPAPQIAQFLGIMEIIVPDYQYDSAAGGQAKVLADVWDDEYALLTLVDNSGDIRRPRLGTCFIFSKLGDASVHVESWWNNDPPMDCYSGEMNYGLELMQSKDSSGNVVSNIGVDVSQLISNITA